MQRIRLDEDYIVPKHLTNAQFIVESDTDVTIYLNEVRPGTRFEILQLSENAVEFNCNSETTSFLIHNKPNVLRVEGTPDTYGKSVIIESFEGSWRIVGGILEQHQIYFED